MYYTLDLCFLEPHFVISFKVNCNEFSLKKPIIQIPFIIVSIDFSFNYNVFLNRSWADPFSSDVEGVLFIPIFINPSNLSM